ncbi:hypothetical protein J8281_03580 [Aquimarina sp. U1-2]|uniref:hypothetical protein n=1 Tax=Aquimarina sp. U1-2 TaxID=2823141 RepID=UPI001AECDED4|nr:hypothetical protein [Aquimarina sp. U1-2]MBP2831259.1 hypothetical protein [Aquimarina sp. U1-2]
MAVPVAAYKAGQMAWQNRSRISVSSQLTTVILATGAGVGAFLGIRLLIRNFKKGVREQQALVEGNPASYAIRLKMAFENDTWLGWGTDEEAVFITLELIPSQSIMRKVQKAYRDLYQRNLAADLKEELTTEEFTTAMQIINSKP